MTTVELAIYRNYVDEISKNLENALQSSMHMQQVVESTEGDSDLNRYLNMYLIPAMRHWIDGAQAGNMKFLSELFDRREKELHTT